MKCTGLVTASLGGDISSGQRRRLDQLVHQDNETCDLYLKLIFESSILLTWAGHGEPQSIRKEELASPSPAPTFPAILPTSLFPSTLGYSSGWTMAYLSATVITGLLILGFWLMPVSRPEQIARIPCRRLPSDSLPRPAARWAGSPAWSTASGTVVLVFPWGRNMTWLQA